VTSVLLTQSDKTIFIELAIMDSRCRICTPKERESNFMYSTDTNAATIKCSNINH